MAKARPQRRIGPKDLRTARGGAASVKGGVAKKLPTDAPRKGTPAAAPG